MANRIAPLIRPQHTAPTSLPSLRQALARLTRVDAPDAQGITENDDVSGITMNSRDVRPGDLYVALPGENTHGARFAGEAVASGAVAVLTDAAGSDLAGNLDIPIMVVADPRSVLGPLSSWFYGNDVHDLRMLGITGTNGKTSTSYYMEAILKFLGHTTGLSTTVERHVGDQIIGSALTTPEASQLQALIARMRELSADSIILEISAQAVTRHRIDGTRVNVMGFTNLSPEHLDEYGDMEEYYQAKRALFTDTFTESAVVSIESEWGQRLFREIEVPKTAVGLDASADWRVEIRTQTSRGGTCSLTTPDGTVFDIRLGVPGAHMAVNAAVAVAMLSRSGIVHRDLKRALAADVLVDVYLPGRLELVSGDGAPKFFVDYAHTPDAFDRTLAAVREQTDGRVILVFGADGGRDPYKRPDMGQAAARGADVVVVCDINPRFEDAVEIRRVLVDAARATNSGAKIVEVADPAGAIRFAVGMATSRDTIIVCGPGDEDYHEVRGKKLPYSARSAARQALAEAGWAVRLPPQRELGQE